jgi:hypothetical protein
MKVEIDPEGETTMRFMMIVKCNMDSEAGRLPDPKLMEAMAKYTEESIKAGVLLTSGALTPTSKGARIRASGGKLSVVDGPFAEATELVGGFAILQAKSMEEAMEHGRRFMKLHQDVLGPTYEGTLEVRPMLGPEDFAPPPR